MNSYKRWVTMATLCLSGGTIFMLPFLRDVYYIPMQTSFHHLFYYQVFPVEPQNLSIIRKRSDKKRTHYLLAETIRPD